MLRKGSSSRGATSNSRPSSVINQTDLENAVLFAKCRRRRHLFKNLNSGTNFTNGFESVAPSFKVGDRSLSAMKQTTKRIRPFMKIKDIDTRLVGQRTSKPYCLREKSLKSDRDQIKIPVQFQGHVSRTFYVSPSLGESIKCYQNAVSEQQEWLRLS